MIDKNDEPAHHAFGSFHTIAKLSIIAKFLPAYTTALSRQRFALHYVDAFAGTGTCYVKDSHGSRLLVPGSASIALDCRPPFCKMVFVEKKSRHADALRRLAEGHPGRHIEVMQGGANERLPQILASLDRQRDRAVIFLDPYGMELDWATLKQIADTKLCDVWYLFPLSGLYRQAARDASDIDPDKEKALTRMLGTDRWRAEFYRPTAQADLFGAPPREERTLNALQLSDWVTVHLRTVFPGVLEPKILYQTLPGGAQGAPLYALYFAVSNDSPKAIGLAMKIAREIVTRA